MQIGDFLNKLEGVKSQKGGRIARCPAHDDRKASLSVSEGDDGRILLKCHAGCEADAIAGALGLTMADLFVEKRSSGGRVIETTYDYRDEAGKLSFEVVRYAPKDFRQRRPDGAGGWIWNLKGVQLVPYRLPELLAADHGATVFIAEGEKDVDRLRSLGLVATCNPMGAGKWRDEYSDFLIDREVVILPDNDDSGRDHARAVAASLRGKASKIQILELPRLKPKGDVSNWLDAGGTEDQLCQMAEAAPEWKPDPEGSSGAEPAHISISWADLCEMKFPPRETLLHEIERGEVVMVAAITNRGKTTFVRNASIALATGREYLPLVKAGTPRVVYYLDFETGLSRARADIMKMLGALPQSERALMARNFHLVADCRIDELPLSLSNPKHLAFVEEDARRVGADVIIVDTVTVAFDFQDENNNAECTRVMKRLIRLARQLGAVVIFLHHIGKVKQEEGQTAHNVHRSRGGSALSGASTAIINLLPDPKADDVFTLECAKVKGDKFEDRLFKLDKETRWFTSAGVVEKPTSTYDQVVGAFNGKPLKRADVQRLLPNVSKTTLGDCLKKAVEAGDLVSPSYGTYQKPNLPDLPPPIGSGNSGNSTQPFDGVEDSLDFGDRGENSDPVTSRGQPYDLSPWLGGRHPDDYDDGGHF